MTQALSAAAQLVSVDAARSTAMRRLFAEVFGHDMSAELWHWKYADGRGLAVGLQVELECGEGPEAELLAHVGGVPREAVLGGQRVRALQLCDVMVASAARRSLARNGPLRQLTAHLLETQIGWTAPHAIGYGFPTERAFAVAERLGLYAKVDGMVCVTWPTESAADLATEIERWAPSAQRLTDAAAVERGPLAATLDGLGQAMIDSLPGLTQCVRSAAWVAHRYLRHPSFEYEVHLLRRRWSRRPLGVLVLRRHETHLEWVDTLAAVGDWESVRRAACRRAQELQLPQVEAWITRSQQQRLLDLAPGQASVRALGIDIPANVHSAGPGVEALRDRWLLMAGDTDFR